MKSDINKNTRLQRTFNKYFKLNDTDLCILDCYGCSISKKIHPTIMSTYANANNHFLVRQINNKMAGNSIVTNCMTHMFYNLFINRPKKKDIELW